MDTKNALRKSAIIMWLTVSAFYFYQFFLRVYPSVLSKELMQHLGIGAASLGTLVGCYYYVYTFLQIPIGLFLDKFGTKKVVVLSIFCCALGSLLFISHSYYVSVIGRCLTGLGSACSFCACLKIANNWFPPKQLGLVTTLTVSLGSLGPIFGVPIFATLLKTNNWIHVLYVVSAIGLALMLITMFILKDAPEGSEKHADGSLKMLDSCRAILSDKNTYFLLIYGFCAYAPVSAFADMWGVPFLKLQYPMLSTAQASVLTNSLYVGMIFGPFLSPFAEKIGKARTMSICALMMAIPFYILITCSALSYYASYACIFSVGFFTTGQLFAYPIAYQSMPAKLSGLISGILNAGAMLSGAVLQPLLGKVLELSWNGRIINGLPYYGPSCYKTGFMTVVILLIIAIFVPLFIKEETTEK